MSINKDNPYGHQFYASPGVCYNPPRKYNNECHLCKFNGYARCQEKANTKQKEVKSAFEENLEKTEEIRKLEEEAAQLKQNGKKGKRGRKKGSKNKK